MSSHVNTEAVRNLLLAAEARHARDPRMATFPRVSHGGKVFSTCLEHLLNGVVSPHQVIAAATLPARRSP
jgi:hypothetical protein